MNNNVWLETGATIYSKFLAQNARPTKAGPFASPDTQRERAFLISPSGPLNLRRNMESKSEVNGIMLHDKSRDSRSACWNSDDSWSLPRHYDWSFERGVRY